MPLTTQELYGINFSDNDDDQEFWLWLDEVALTDEADSFADFLALDNDFELEVPTVSLNEATDELRQCGYDLQLSSCGKWLIATDHLQESHWLQIEDGRIDECDLATVYLGS